MSSSLSAAYDLYIVNRKHSSNIVSIHRGINMAFSKFSCKLLFKLHVSTHASARKRNLLHSTNVPSNDPFFTPALYDKKEER
jgi:hypothetical protein